MLALLQEVTNQVPLYLQEREAWARSFQAIVTPILLTIGGLFALYKFIFEGAFSKRVQPNASAVAIVGGDRLFLRVSLTAKNIGTRKIDLNKQYTGLSVSFLTTTEDWSEPEPNPVLGEQDFIKPGETVGDQVWLTILDENVLAVDLRFYVFNNPPTEGWMHREIVSLVQEQV